MKVVSVWHRKFCVVLGGLLLAVIFLPGCGATTYDLSVGSKVGLKVTHSDCGQHCNNNTYEFRWVLKGTDNLVDLGVIVPRNGSGSVSGTDWEICRDFEFNKVGEYSLQAKCGAGDWEVCAHANVVAMLSIEGVAESDKQSGGGVAVLDGKRKKITLKQVKPTSYSGDVVLSKTSSKIKVYDSATGGTEITFNGTDNKFANAQLPKTLYVEAASASTSMRDVQIDFAAPDGYKPEDFVKFTVIEQHLKQISYSGTKYHAVREDDDSADYSAPHWQDNSTPLDGDADDTGDRNYPVCFTRNTKMKAAGEWTLNLTLSGVTATIKGNGPGSIDVPQTAATSGTSKVNLPETEAGGAFNNTVCFLNPMQIDWEISFDGGTTWDSACSSKNRVYVTYGDPVATTLFETLLDIGCRNASGETNDGSIATKIWLDFKDRSVARKAKDGHNTSDGKIMFYWYNSDPPQHIYPVAPKNGMLGDPDGNGSCLAWSELFSQTLRAQHLPSAPVISQVTADTTVNPGAGGFLVKAWTFGSHIRARTNGVCNTTATGDDLPVIANGEGAPNMTAITAGVNGVLDTTTPTPDDSIVKTTIVTGGNGICNTTAVPDDDQLIPLNQGGDSDAICVTPGPNGVLNSTPGGDDGPAVDGIHNGSNYPYVLYSYTSGGVTSGVDYGDCAEQTGVAGQGTGNTNPPPAFGNHYVVKYGGKIYDPSYGNDPYNSEDEHENASIDGIVAAIGGELRAKKNNPTTKELDYSP